MSVLPLAIRTKCPRPMASQEALCPQQVGLCEEQQPEPMASSAALQALQDIAVREIVQQALAIETQSMQPGAFRAASSFIAHSLPLASAKAVCICTLLGGSIGMDQALVMVRGQAEPASMLFQGAMWAIYAPCSDRRRKQGFMWIFILLL